MTAEIKSQVSAEEWQLRVDLAAAYRLVALFGWDDLVFTHISARVPGADNHFLINPYGMMFEEVTASSLVKVDQNGEKVMESPYPVNPAGFTIHSAVHAARDDAHSIINKALNLLKVKGLQKADLGFYRRFYRQNHGLFVSAGDAAIFPATVLSTQSSTT